jgi:hypothetical protein
MHHLLAGFKYSHGLETELVILGREPLLAITIPNQVLLFRLLESSYLSLRCHQEVNMRMNACPYWEHSLPR